MTLVQVIRNMSFEIDGEHTHGNSGTVWLPASRNPGDGVVVRIFNNGPLANDEAKTVIKSHEPIVFGRFFDELVIYAQ